MTTSGMPAPRRFTHDCLPMLCLVQLCLFLLLPCHQLHQFNFVQGMTWSQPRPTKCQESRRFSQKGSQTPAGRDDKDDEAEARRLTTGIKKANSAKKLLDILDEKVDGPAFDFIHASAVYTQLVTLQRTRGSQKIHWDSSVLLRLHARVQDMVLQDQLEPRQSANVLWSIAQLSDRFSTPTRLLVALVKSMSTKVIDMKPQELSNCLWAIAKLKDIVPGVLEVVPAVVAQIPNRVKDMIPQHLSNCMWACLQLKEDVPRVLEIVPAVVAETPAKIEDMVPQALCNSLEALMPLQESVPEVARFLKDDGNERGIVRSAAARLNTLFPKLSGKDLVIAVPAVVWACAKAGVHHDQLLASVAERFGSRAQLSRLKDFGLCALSWSYHVLDSEDDFKDFQKLLKSETERRRLSEADVESSRHGYLKWNRANC